eukprot:SAG31_NODE_5011_length_2802_cov_6.880133_2_plen_82_part_00
MAEAASALFGHSVFKLQCVIGSENGNASDNNNGVKKWELLYGSAVDHLKPSLVSQNTRPWGFDDKPDDCVKWKKLLQKAKI